MSAVDVVMVLRAAGCVFAEDEAALLTAEAPTVAALDAMVTRRVQGEPLEYILGWAEFCGLRIAVAPGVFVPRRRTSFLVDLAADFLAELNPRSAPDSAVDSARGSDPDHARDSTTDSIPGSIPGSILGSIPGSACDSARDSAVDSALDLAGHSVGPVAPVVVDLCCGSGAVGAALAARAPGVELHAADLDATAVDCARRNTASFGGRCYVGDLWLALPSALRARVDALVVNAPYVPSDEVELMPREARQYEARVALDGGADGLDLHRRIAIDARSWLAPGGRLFIETSQGQAPITAGIFAGNGLTTVVEHRDDDDATVVVAARD